MENFNILNNDTNELCIKDNQPIKMLASRSNVITRNYLNLKPNRTNNALQSSTYAPNYPDQLSLKKRSRSISRSLRNLFIRNGNEKMFSRDKSIDSAFTNSTFVNQDFQSGITCF